MNYYFTGILIILLCLIAFIGPAYPNTTQNNTSGSNTSITGGYTSSATNTYPPWIVTGKHNSIIRIPVK